MANTSGSKFTSRVQQQTASLIRAIERIHEEESEIFITRADNISRENDRLRKELYDFQQRIKILTDRLGFDNLDRAEESLNDKLAGAIQEHKAAVGRINALTSELESVKTQLVQEQAARVEEQQQVESLKSDLARRKQVILDAQSESERDREALGRLKVELQSEWQKSSKLESQVSTYRKENERLTSECEELKSALAKDRVQRLSLVPETPLRGPIGIHSSGADLGASSEQHPSGLDDISSLPLDVQITHLRRQYDELLLSKERLSEKYAKDLADWAMFKEKYRGSSGGKGLIVSESGIKTRRRVAKQAKDSPTPSARTSHPRMVPATPADDDVFVKEEEHSLAPGSLPPLQRLQLNPPSLGPAAPNDVTPATSNTETQDSQSVTPAGPANGRCNKEAPPNLKFPGQKPPVRPDIASIKQGSQSDNEGGLHLRKLSHVNTAPPLARSLSSPAESPHHPKDTPRRTKVLGKRKAFLFDGESSGEEGAGGLVLAPIPQRTNQPSDEREAQLRALRRKSGPQAVGDYQQFKGRGRYAVASKTGDKTINSEFEINPVHNEGMAFEFDSVVRDKNERKKLIAGDCIACKEYYEAVGAMPARSGAPLWRSPPPDGAAPSSRPHSSRPPIAASKLGLGLNMAPSAAGPSRRPISPIEEHTEPLNSTIARESESELESAPTSARSATQPNHSRDLKLSTAGRVSNSSPMESPMSAGSDAPAAQSSPIPLRSALKNSNANGLHADRSAASSPNHSISGRSASRERNIPDMASSPLLRTNGRPARRGQGTLLAASDSLQVVDEDLLNNAEKAAAVASEMWALLGATIDSARSQGVGKGVIAPVDEGLSNALDATSKLRASLRAVREGTVKDAGRRQLYEIAMLFAKNVTHAIVLLRNFSSSYSISPSLRSTAQRVTQATQEMIFYLRGSSFAPPPSARPTTPAFAGGLGLGVGDNGFFLSRSRSAAVGGVVASSGPTPTPGTPRDVPWSAMPGQSFKKDEPMVMSTSLIGRTGAQMI
ncbi:unnamed protein product [Rhizoctonia solani]|uniref:DNA endonuclease activator Ctp1 C-terminal domain-containing protein n=1 Tax=Rhizoctonia solani TaxID=456999 RepID=A0A8H3E6Q0_9AGAM|nr:unnamed protein product [Rhizoctonia solani]